MKHFTELEAEMIKESLELRRKNTRETEYKYLIKLQNTENKLLNPLSNLYMVERSLITGCIKDLIIYPNEKITGMTDYELLINRKDIENICIKLDVAFSILNKIKPRDNGKIKLFSQKFELFDKIFNQKKAYYSINTFRPNGEVYKIGIPTGYNKGFRLETSFGIEFIGLHYVRKHSFMHESSIKELVNYIKNTGEDHKLDKGNWQFLEIMKMYDNI